MDEQQGGTRAVTVFYSYAHEDEKLANELEKHLTFLQRQGVITMWYDRQIVPGTDRAHDIDTHLNEADIILLLISPDYLASDYCYSTEMQCALERHTIGSTRVIPLILRPVDWHTAPFAHLSCLPRDEKPVTLWRNRDAAFYNIAQGIRAVIADLRGSIASVPQSTITPMRMRQRPTTREERNRQQFLRRVRSIWVTGVLEHSLNSVDLIVPAFHEQPHALSNPWKLLMQETEGSARPLPSGTRITQIYEDADNELLILGNPGSGKTTLLLELTQELLDRAEQNETYPMPVVFNLSSWAEKRAPLSLWFIEELEIRYQIPRAIATEWVHTEQLTLLLDGLDEVVVAHRGACINAINAYRHEHTLVPIVVCSRIEEYRTQKTQLVLHKAMSVEPLTVEQIDTYLANVGEHVEAVRLALRGDKQLQELVTSPLMLNVLILAYQGKSLDDLLVTSTEKRQQLIFETYVERMLSRGKAEMHYTREQTKYWLMWLARQMQQHDQATFYLEQMQPSWLSRTQLYTIYTYLALRLPDMLTGACMSLVVVYLFFRTLMDISSDLRYGILGALAGGLLSSRQQEQPSVEFHAHSLWEHFRYNFLKRSYVMNGFVVALSYGLLVGLNEKNFFTGFCYGLGFGFASYLLSFLVLGRQRTRPHTDILIHVWEQLWNNFISYKSVNTGLIVGLCMALGYVLSTELTLQFHNTQRVVIAYALVYLLNYTQVGILLDIILKKRKPFIQPAEIVAWSWKNLWYSFSSAKHLRDALLIGFLSGLLTALSTWFRGPLGPGTGYGLSTGIIIGLCYWLFHGLSGGVSSNTLDKDHRLTPNQGIWYSARNSILIGFISAVTSWGLYLLSNILYSLLRYIDRLSWIIWTTIWSVTWLSIGTSYAVPIAVSIGILSAFIGGGLACLQHCTLRLLLWRSGYIPWNYPQFLNYTDRHILLRKVGGGYMFIHRLLLDYFASCEASTQERTD